MRRNKSVFDLPLSVTCPEEGECALVQSWEGEEGRRVVYSAGRKGKEIKKNTFLITKHIRSSPRI